MWRLGCLIIIFWGFFILEFHAKWVFVATGYPRRYGHGKSWKRAHKHYKTNWTFWQRLFWIPVFKEHYEDKYRFMAYFSYVHIAVTLLMIIFVAMGELWIGNAYVWFAFLIFVCSRFIYDDAVGRRKI